MTQSVPASYFVNVLPGVLNAGGTALQLSGLMLTTSTRVPVGTVVSFPNAAAVGNYFGLASNEYAKAVIYFNGFSISTQKPAALLFTQYVWQTPVNPYLRGASLASLTLAQLQAITPGTLTITINGTAWTSGSINLSSASSFSNAASIIQTALAAQDATVTGAITVANGVTGAGSTISGTTLTVATISSGVIVPGAVLTGTGVTAGTTIVSQLTGTPGGVGTYTVSATQTVSATAITATGANASLLTVTAVSAGFLAVGQIISGTGVTAGTTIVSLLSGSGGTGTYVVSNVQTASSTTILAGAAVVTYDSVTSAFVITGGTPGATGTIGFASGAIATSLSLTSATGAVTSQGAGLSTPVTFMNNVIAQTQNWAAFCNLFTPVVSDQVLFAQWNNSQNNCFAYIQHSTDASVTTNSDTASSAYLIQQAGYGGVSLNYEPSDQSLSAFILGCIASIDFTAENGRTTFAYLNQSGLPVGVTSSIILAQLQANGVNAYVAAKPAAPAAQGFNFYWNGSVTGPYLWLDAYINQIWMNANFQLALMSLLTNIKAIPYNTTGYQLMTQALSSPIAAAVNFGAIVSGVTLSGVQIAAANAAAGKDISGVLQSRGWYLSIQDPGAIVRQARGTPNSIFFYTDGESVQQITLNSIDIL